MRLRPHRQLVQRLLQPQADERSQGVVEDQQHDGIDKVVPLTIGVHDELPRVGTVDLDDGGEAKDSAETFRTERERDVSAWKRVVFLQQRHSKKNNKKIRSTSGTGRLICRDPNLILDFDQRTTSGL